MLARARAGRGRGARQRAPEPGAVTEPADAGRADPDPTARAQAAGALLANGHLGLDPYLHQLMPAALTCLVARRLGPGAPGADHWALRRRAGALVAAACGRFGAAYENLQPRVTAQLLRALLDARRPLATHYGARASARSRVRVRVARSPRTVARAPGPPRRASAEAAHARPGRFCFAAPP